jgi:hypothetical protein
MIVWEFYNHGEAHLTFLDRQGKPFSGTSEEFEKLHGNLVGLKNKITEKIILINEHGEIAAHSPKKQTDKSEWDMVTTTSVD